VYREYEPAWLLIVVYAGVFMVLAGIQVRFAAQFMIPLSVLGGVGFVYALSAVDLARRPRPLQGGETRSRPIAADGGDEQPTISLPDRRKAAYVLGIGLLVCSFSLLYVPAFSVQVSHGDAKHEAVVAIEDHAEETDREYPETFVLSEWSDNRMYNYHVNGESRSYSYARSTYDDFRFGDDPDGQYDDFDDRVGYVVVTDVDGDVPSDSAQAQLLDEFGAGDDGSAALAHYQLLAVDADRSASAFAVVPGATIEGTTAANETITVATDVAVDGAAFTYEREVTAGPDGAFNVTVAYPGEYAIGDERVDVTPVAVENGSTIDHGTVEPATE